MRFALGCAMLFGMRLTSPGFMLRLRTLLRRRP
jgi:hypothetical protein